MPSPLAPLLTLALALPLALGVGACRKQSSTSEKPDQAPRLNDRGPTVDAPAVCQAGCARLESCVPQLSGDFDTDPSAVAERLAESCDPACADFDDQRASLAVRDCLSLDGCGAYWGCVGGEAARPWLAAVAPVGERSCDNLCAQASACAITEVCGESSPDTPDDSSDPRACIADDARRTELDETCRLRCRGTVEAGQARAELIGCLDSGTCGGMLSCIDGWSHTDYSRVDGPAPGPVPGIDPTCDAFCTRAIACGAEDIEDGETLSLEDLAALKQSMTGTYVECAVQCEKDQTSEATRASFEACTQVETCAEFATCADEV